MQCNIDAKGRALRLVSGIVVTLAAVVILVLAMLGVGDATVMTTLGVLLLLGGGFQIYEGWAGWCVVRAMGFKTPI